jgi:hypothetical protein
MQAPLPIRYHHLVVDRALVTSECAAQRARTNCTSSHADLTPEEPRQISPTA